MIVTTVELIDPTRAKEILDLTAIIFEREGIENRKVWMPDVRKIAKDILNNKWQTTHQGILLGKDGRLIDGQHRLNSVITANKAILIQVSRNEELLSPLGLECDSGRKRSLAWTHSIPKKEGEVGRIMISLVTNNFDGTNCKAPNDTTPTEFKIMAEAVKDEHAFLSKTTRTCFSSAPIRAAAILSMDGINNQEIADQYYLLVSHKQEGMWPILLGFERELTKRLEKIPGGGLGQSDLMARAFKAFSGNRDLKQLRLGMKGTPTKEDILSKLKEARNIAMNKYGWILEK